MKAFKSLIDFQKEFGTVEQCKAYLALARWNGSPVCPHCGHGKVYTTNRGYKCASSACYKKFTVTVGTIYHETKLPLTKWFLALYFITVNKKGLSSYQLGRHIGVSQKTAWFMLHRLREQNRAKNVAKFEGTVEVDETYIGGKAANKHEWERKKLFENGTGAVNKQPVVGMLERGGDIRTFHIYKADGLTIKPIVMDNLQYGSTLITDGFGAYKDLDKFYYHTIVNHSQGVFTVGEHHTNTVEGFWSLLKRGIYGIYHQVSPQHLSRYCDEFAFRYNTRKLKDDVRFNISLINADGCRLPYKQLVKRP